MTESINGKVTALVDFASALESEKRKNKLDRMYGMIYELSVNGFDASFLHQDTVQLSLDDPDITKPRDDVTFADVRKIMKRYQYEIYMFDVYKIIRHRKKKQLPTQKSFSKRLGFLAIPAALILGLMALTVAIIPSAIAALVSAAIALGFAGENMLKFGDLFALESTALQKFTRIKEYKKIEDFPITTPAHVLEKAAAGKIIVEEYLSKRNFYDAATSDARTEGADEARHVTETVLPKSAELTAIDLDKLEEIARMSEAHLKEPVMTVSEVIGRKNAEGV